VTPSRPERAVWYASTPFWAANPGISRFMSDESSTACLLPAAKT
jgi:hypothetical protein